MKARHLLLAIAITAIWGANFSVIKLGLTSVDPFILAGIRFTLCALPAIFFIPKPDVPWRYIMGPCHLTKSLLLFWSCRVLVSGYMDSASSVP